MALPREPQAICRLSQDRSSLLQQDHPLTEAGGNVQKPQYLINNSEIFSYHPVHKYSISFELPKLLENPGAQRKHDKGSQYLQSSRGTEDEHFIS